MTNEVLTELAANGPLIMVLAWQLHLAQSKTLVLLERVLTAVENNARD